jgi:prophage endopeptidase
MIPGAVWRYGAAFALGLAVAGTAQGWRYTAQIATAEAAISAERAEAMKFVLAEQEASAARMAEADQKYTGELSDAKGKIADLEQRVAAGTSGLRVKAKCPAAKQLPETGSASSVGDRDGESAELSANARPDYYALRLGIAGVEAALKACVEGR